MLKELIESGAILKSPVCINRLRTFREKMGEIIPSNAAFYGIPDVQNLASNYRTKTPEASNAAFYGIPDVQWDKNFYPYVKIDGYQFKLSGTMEPVIIAKPICVDCELAGGDPNHSDVQHMSMAYNPPAALVALLQYHPQPWTCDGCHHKSQHEEAA